MGDGKRFEDYDEDDLTRELDMILRDPNTQPKDRLKAVEMIAAYKKGKPSQQKQEEVRKPPRLKPVQDMTPQEREDAKAWALSELDGNVPPPLQAWLS